MVDKETKVSQHAVGTLGCVHMSAARNFQRLCWPRVRGKARENGSISLFPYKFQSKMPSLMPAHMCSREMAGRWRAAGKQIGSFASVVAILLWHFCTGRLGCFVHREICWMFFYSCPCALL